MRVWAATYFATEGSMPGVQSPNHAAVGWSAIFFKRAASFGRESFQRSTWRPALESGSTMK